MADVPMLIEFAPHTSLYRERELVSQLPIIRNGPAGTFVVFPRGLRVSLPVFVRIREVLPDDQLSPARSHRMLLNSKRVATVSVDGRPVWRGASRRS